VIAGKHYLRGRVVGSSGLPLGQFEVNGFAFRTTDGSFEQARFRPHPFIDVRASGYAPVIRAIDKPEDEDVFLSDIVLSRGRRVEGRVIEAANGAPIGAARVSAYPEPMVQEAVAKKLHVIEPTFSPFGWTPIMSFELSLPDQIATPADGSFTLQHVDPGDAVVFVEDEGYVSTLARVPAGEDHVTVTLVRASSIEGTLRMPGQYPSSEARLIVDGPDFRQGAVAENGAFRIGGLPPGHYQVTGATRFFLLRKVVEVDVAPGATAHVDIQLVNPGSEGSLDHGQP
jgi:hypothetical protein